MTFQSTQPKRAATCCRITVSQVQQHFNPRSPRGLRQLFVSIAAHGKRFQSTQPKRAATVEMQGIGYALANFNPRSPRGLRRKSRCVFNGFSYFNPRSPRGLRQKTALKAERDQKISIHAAQEGCDLAGNGEVQNRNISIHAAQEGCDAMADI